MPDQQLAHLPRLTLAELRSEWAKLYGRPPSRYMSRELLMRVIAYRLQEKAYGGLKPAIARKLQRVMEELRQGGQPTITPAVSIQPGVRLMREWQGETHVVEVHAKGSHYSSLSAIARAITGGSWSGPRFFGLHDKRRNPVSKPRNGQP
jgi:hypothetical protein